VFYRQTVLLTAIVFLAVTGFAARLEQMYFMAGLLAFLTLGAYLIARFSTRGLELQRGPAHKLSEGGWCDLSITVTNRSLLPKAFISLRDELPAWLEPVSPAEVALPTLLPRRSARLTYRVRATKRGVFKLGPVVVSATDLLGAFHAERRIEAPQELIVYPTPERFSAEALAGALTFGGWETAQATLAGAGMELYGIRDYRPGDALRRIHWPSTARLGHFHVVEFEETLGADLVIAVDLRRGAHAGAGKDSTLEVAIKAAASLAAHAVDNGARAMVVGRDGGRSYRVAAGQPGELPLLLEALARMEAQGEWSLAQVMAEVEGPAAGAAAVLLTAAPEAGLLDLVGAWVRRRAQVVVMLFDAGSYGAQPAPDVYAWEKRLRVAGARVEIVRRGDQLERVLGRAMADAA